MLTRKHFEAIAAIIASELPSKEDRESDIAFEAIHMHTRNLTRDLSDFFKEENSAFDRERFMRACGF